MAEALTPEQKQAVENRGGRLLVSAAAGSGKTKVLVDRLLGYLIDPIDPANIDDFLMITYTKAAAAELRGKIAAKLTERVALEPQNSHLQRQMQRLYLTKISTVHAFCGEILREYAFELNLAADFRVADENECVQLRAQVMEKVLAETYETDMDDSAFRAFADSQGLGRDDRQIPQIVLQVYDSSRCHREPQKWLDACCASPEAEEIADAAQTVYGKFLIDRLHEWLDLQTQIMRTCAERAEAVEGFAKPAALLRDTVNQLSCLRQAESWDEIALHKKIDFGRLTFPKNCADAQCASDIKAAREACKKGLEKQLRPFADPSAQVLADLRASAQAVRGLTALTRRFSNAYDAAKKSRRILDFGDLEHKMLDLLLGKSRTAPTSAAAEIGARFREVMVDEYQDSNAVQDAIYNALTAKRGNLFMVGDVKQSIYQFRLADPQIFLEKYRTFANAQQAYGRQDRKVVLSRNFRSCGAVLEACNDVFSLCMSPQVGGMYYGEDEALHEGKPHAVSAEPAVELHCIDVCEQTHPEEAEFVADHIQNLLRTGSVHDADGVRPVRPEDIAILLRSPGTAGAYYQRALERRGIRFAAGGGVDLLKTEEIGTLYAVLQLIHNPRMDIPLVAALSSPAFAFTADELAAIRAKHKSGAFFDALQRDDSEKSKTFLRTLERLRAVRRYYGLTKLLDRVLSETCLEEIYASMDDAPTRLANIRTFYQLAVDFEAAGNADLGFFLEHLQTLEEKGLISSGEQEMHGCVTVMSIHKSKGLEFPIIYLCGLAREFNMESQRAAVLCHKEMGVGLAAVDHRNRLRYPTVAKRAIAAKIGQESVSEELRVLYVAMTRAQERLIMTYASPRLQQELTQTVRRMNMGALPMLTREALCPGDWVLLTALQKTEAGALHALAGRPPQTHSGEFTWKISVDTSAQPTVAQTQTANISAAVSRESMEKIEKGLLFRYAHDAATRAPSKLTATGLKGRYKDEEAAEQTPRTSARHWRQPFSSETRLSGKAYGNAVHAVMQYIDYASCTSVQAVARELYRLRTQNFITAEQANAVSAEMIATFFATPIGEKLRTGQIVREFKFSVLLDGTLYNSSLDGERILLQGVVDCALIEEQGITIIDFKTDIVDEDSLAQKVAAYTPQVNAYAQAMERIFEKPICRRMLYFFCLNRFVSV